MMKNILIINGDEEDTKQLTVVLTSKRTNVLQAKSVEEAISQFMNNELCLIVLDSQISIEDDHNLLKAMRYMKSTPILVLSSHSDHSDRLNYLQAGAHAYMGKPYTMEECLAQAQALIQLHTDTVSKDKRCLTLVCGNGLVIDPTTRRVFLNETELHVSRKEFDLLLFLASNAGQVLSKEQLYNHIWEYDSAYNVDEVIKAHIKSLRKKLSGADFEYIKNVWGVGYRFEKDNRG